MRYEDRQLTPLGLLRWGKRETFCGTVTTLQTQPSKNVGNRLWLCYCRTTVAP